MFIVLFNSVEFNLISVELNNTVRSKNVWILNLLRHKLRSNFTVQCPCTCICIFNMTSPLPSLNKYFKVYVLLKILYSASVFFFYAS